MGLWKHNTKPTTFCLCVDDFGIGYFNEVDVNNLLQSLQNNYTATVDWSLKNIYGLTFDWKYHNVY